MSGWELDTARFADEVLVAAADGWDVRENLFRFFQLPLDVADDAVVDTAVRKVHDHLKLLSIRGAGTQAATANMLRGVVAQVEPQVRETARRAEHRKLVLARRARFVEDVRADLRGRGMPALRPAEMESHVLRTRRWLARNEVEEALAAAGVEVREPVEFDVPGHPTRWKDIRQKLRQLEQPSLAAYLTARRLDAGATRVDIARVRKNLDRTGSGDRLKAEQSVLAAVERLVGPPLAAALRRELIDELSDAAEQGAAVLDAAFDEGSALQRAKSLGLPARAELQYAILCRVRPLNGVESTWRADYEQAVASGELRRAAHVLRSQPHLPPDWADVLAKAEAELAVAAAELAAAEAAERTGDPELAAARYLAVWQATHEPAAEEGLLRCPPPAPAAASARVVADHVVVEWAPARVVAGHASYRVVRRVDRGLRVGQETIAETTNTSAEDPDPPGGVGVRYEVTTLRETVTPLREISMSARPAETSPVVVLRSVTDLAVDARADEVGLSWSLPEGAVGVRLRRAHGSASVELPSGRTRAHDSSVRSDQDYVYAVEAVYVVDGERRHAAAAAIDAHPQEPPEAVLDLSVAEDVDGGSAVASWSEPPRGTVMLWLTHEAPPPSGTLRRAEARFGEPVKLLGKEGAGFRCVLPVDGRRRWIVPVTVSGELAAVGRPVEHDRRLPPVIGLRAVRQGHQVRLMWEWPTRAGDARVLVRNGQPVAGPTDAEASAIRVSRAHYERSGCRVPVEAGAQLWFAVCVAAYDNGEELCGPLVQTSLAAPVVARFTIVPAGRGRRRIDVTGQAPLPQVQVRGRVALPPLTADDGTALLVLTPPSQDATTMNAVFDLLPGRPLHLRAFPTGAGVELVPDDPHQLRVDRGLWR